MRRENTNLNTNYQRIVEAVDAEETELLLQALVLKLKRMHINAEKALSDLHDEGDTKGIVYVNTFLNKHTF